MSQLGMQSGSGQNSGPRVHSVSELTQVIKRTLEHSFPYVRVKGELTNLTRASSGHIYFSLKDENALLPCVWYKNQQKAQSFDPNTGEVFDEPIPSLAHKLENGMEMLFSGSLNVYPPRGAYQFIVDSAEEVGKGNLHQAFELLKKKLLALGWFNQEYKKALPKNPKKVAVLTSPQGAVVHDFCRIAKQYGLSSAIHIYPIAVQGSEAVPTIVKAFQNVNKENWADVIVLIRGGGSLEDLWAFNEEEVAKAIFESKIPVITGIGHQVDMSIADYVADVSAATPSHVVSHLWKEKELYAQFLDELEENLHSLIQGKVDKKAEILQFAKKNLNYLSPANKLKIQEENLAIKIQRLNASTRFIKEKERSLKYQIQNFLPLFERNIQKKEREFNYQVQNLLPLFERKMHTNINKFEHLKALLEAHNPYMPLEKGYSLAYSLDNNGKEHLLTSAEILSKNTADISKIMIEFKDGKTIFEAKNLQTIKNSNKEKKK